MKKVLAIALAVIMALGMFSIAASAETIEFEKLPMLPEQQNGKIFFAADNYTYKYGTSPAGTIEVPVYLISDYDASCDVGFVELGCIVAIEGDTSMVSILDVQPSAELKAFAGFEDFDTGYGCSDYSFDDYQGHIAFKVDGDAILHQAKLKVATVTLQINDNFKYESGSETETAPYIFFAPYDFSNIVNGSTADAWPSYGAIFDTDTAINPDEWYIPAAEVFEEGVGNDGNLFYKYGFIAEEPEVEITWIADLVNWFTGILDQIYQVYTTIHQFFQELLPTIPALL